MKGEHNHDVKDNTNNYCNNSLGIAGFGFAWKQLSFVALGLMCSDFSGSVKGIRISRNNQPRLLYVCL